MRIFDRNDIYYVQQYRNQRLGFWLLLLLEVCFNLWGTVKKSFSTPFSPSDSSLATSAAFTNLRNARNAMTDACLLNYL
jgi:hypothetical protein